MRETTAGGLSMHPLEEGIVHVWKVPLDWPDAQVSQLEPLLAPNELQWMRRLRFERDRRRYGAGRLWLRWILAGYLGRTADEIGFRLNAHGKPSLGQPDDLSGLRFNASYSGEIGVCAVTTNVEVGVDVERFRADVDVDHIATIFFTQGERLALRRLPPELSIRGFFTCWTRKEAYVKAVGQGLSLPLDSFDVGMALERGLHEPCPVVGKADGEWSLQDLEIEAGYAAALVVAGRPASIRQVVLRTDITAPLWLDPDPEP